MGSTTKLVYGATTYTLSGDGATVAGCLYFPETPTAGAESIAETCTVTLVGTAAAVRAVVRNLEVALERAALRASRGHGDDVFVKYTAASGETENRSRVLGGRLVWPDEPARRRLAGGIVEVALIWEREPFWEDVDLVELPLANSSGGPATGGRTIYNHDDSTSGHDNYVEITGSDVVGSLPAPLYLVMVNSATGVGARRFVLGSDVHYDIGSNAVLEGESSDGSFTTTGAASASNGNYATVTWPTNTEHDDLVNTSSSLLLYWTLPTALMTASDGGWWSVVGRFHSTPAAGIYGKLRLVYPEPGVSVTSVLWEGPEFELEARRLQVLGRVPLPPGRGLGYSAPLTLLFTVRAAASGSLDVDFFQLLGADGLRQFEILTGNLDGSDTITVDDTQQAIFTYDASLGYFIPLIADSGSALWCAPGRDQTIRVLYDEGAGTMTISRTLSVSAFYRARRATI